MKQGIFFTVVVGFLLPTVILAQKPSDRLLNPTNQSQMAFATTSIPNVELRSNVAIVTGASKIFNIPTVITTVGRARSGPVFDEIIQFYPEAATSTIDRTTMNAWEDINAYKAITGKNKKKIVFAGLWTEVCIVGPVLSAIAEGYDVYFIADACGGVSPEAHTRAVERMIQAGAQPMTAIQYILELQRDWSRSSTSNAVDTLMKKYGGVYGIGLDYEKAMLDGKK
jgi:nicotinamidase-related amidase